MSNFIHGPYKNHFPVDLEVIANITYYTRKDKGYDHTLHFYTKRGNELTTWFFKHTSDNDDKELLFQTFKNIKNELGSKNINDTVKL